jgi:hypothetical protein
MPDGVIGNTTGFGPVILGSSPNRVTNFPYLFPNLNSKVMLNRDYEINQNQLFWKYREQDGLFYHTKYPWEHLDPHFGKFRGEFDTLWRSGLGYITYGCPYTKQGIINCFRPYIIGEQRDPSKVKYQASRASNRFGEDDVSRDQVILALSALEFNGDIEEVQEIASRLPFRLSRRFLMTPTMWFWVKYLATREEKWRNRFAFMQTLEHAINIPITKFLRWLSGANKPIPLPHDQHSKLPYKKGIRYQLYKTLGYPEYGLHFAAWQQYVVPFGGFLGWLNKSLMRWQMEDSNLLLRLLIGDLIDMRELVDIKPTNTFIWQRRSDIATAWIYELKPEEVEYNNIEVDIIKTLLDRI